MRLIEIMLVAIVSLIVLLIATGSSPKPAQAGELTPQIADVLMVSDFEDCRMMHGECRLDCRWLTGDIKDELWKKTKYTTFETFFKPCVKKCVSTYWECKKSVVGG